MSKTNSLKNSNRFLLEDSNLKVDFDNSSLDDKNRQKMFRFLYRYKILQIIQQNIPRIISGIILAIVIYFLDIPYEEGVKILYELIGKLF